MPDRSPLRLVLKVPLPTQSENPVLADPAFREKLHALFARLGTIRIYNSRIEEGRQVEFALFEIAEASQIFAIAEPVSLWLKVKPEFLPER